MVYCRLVLWLLFVCLIQAPVKVSVPDSINVEFVTQFVTQFVIYAVTIVEELRRINGGVCLPNQITVEASVVCDLIQGCMPTTIPGTFDAFLTGSQPFPRSGFCSINVPGGDFTVTIPPIPGNTAEICFATFRSCIDPRVEVIRVPFFIRIQSGVTQSSESSEAGSDSGLLGGGSSSSASK